MDRKVFALGLIGLLIIGYIGFIVVEAFSSYSPPAEKPAVRVGDISTATFAGDAAVRQIALRWDEKDLDRTIDPSVQSQFWFSELRDKMTFYRDQLGPITHVAGTATFKPRNDSDYYDYQGEMECELGRASVRILILSTPAGLKIMGAEFTAKPKEVPEDDKAAPTNDEKGADKPKTGMM